MKGLGLKVSAGQTNQNENFDSCAGKKISHKTFCRKTSQITFTCSTSTIEALEKGVKYVQS